jgi:hypothetical protein
VLARATHPLDAHQKLTQFRLLQCNINFRQNLAMRHAHGIKTIAQRKWVKLARK